MTLFQTVHFQLHLVCRRLAVIEGNHMSEAVRNVLTKRHVERIAVHLAQDSNHDDFEALQRNVRDWLATAVAEHHIDGLAHVEQLADDNNTWTLVTANDRRIRFELQRVGVTSCLQFTML